MTANVFFMSHLASKLIGERAVFFGIREPGGSGAARMGAGGTWEIVLDPIEHGPDSPDFLKSFLHEIGHVVCGHVPRQHFTDRDREEARAKYVTPDFAPALAAITARKEAEASAWAEANAPIVEELCLRKFGRSFADLARNGF